jgi:prephenate dehydrogenase
MRDGATLLEVAGVKGPVADALPRIPGRVNVVSGHPMAGTERSGVENAFAGMFQGRPFALIPLRVRDRRALVLARELVRAIGSREVWMLDPAEHDAAVAALTGLTHLAAFALSGLRPDRRLAGPSFLGATRVAASDPAAVAAMLHANRRALRRELSRFVRALKSLAAALAKPQSLRRLLAKYGNPRSRR